jgi:probable rRNA maturation factor
MLAIEVFNAHGKRRAPVKKTIGYVKRVLQSSQVRNARIGVVFVDSRYCRVINRKYLRRDHATDVISFPLEERPVLEGEVYVNLDRARSQARTYGVSFSHEVARLVVHGVLHLLGFDDVTAGERTLMKSEEDRHLRFLFDRVREKEK